MWRKFGGISARCQHKNLSTVQYRERGRQRERVANTNSSRKCCCKSEKKEAICYCTVQNKMAARLRCCRHLPPQDLLWRAQNGREKKEG